MHQRELQHVYIASEPASDAARYLNERRNLVTAPRSHSSRIIESTNMAIFCDSQCIKYLCPIVESRRVAPANLSVNCDYKSLLSALLSQTE